MVKFLPLFLAMLLFTGPALASGEGYTTDKVHLRAGPDSGYPLIRTLPKGTSLKIYGCVNDFSWCEVKAKGERGWISSYFIQAENLGRPSNITYLYKNGQITIVIYDRDDYWRRHYTGKPFYKGPRNYSRYRNDDYNREPRQPKPQPEKPPLKYQPTPLPGTTNPLCPVGQKTC